MIAINAMPTTADESLFINMGVAAKVTTLSIIPYEFKIHHISISNFFYYDAPCHPIIISIKRVIPFPFVPIVEAFLTAGQKEQ